MPTLVLLPVGIIFGPAYLPTLKKPPMPLISTYLYRGSFSNADFKASRNIKTALQEEFSYYPLQKG